MAQVNSSEQAAYEMGRLISSARETLDGQAQKIRLNSIFTAAKSVGLLVDGADRYERWFLEDTCGENALDVDLAFANRALCWLCWLGMGCPEDLEIRFVVEPALEYERIFAGEEEFKARIEEIVQKSNETPEDRRKGFRVV